MAKEIAFENKRISNFEGLVTVTLTLDRVILYTVVHHSSTSTNMPNFIEIEETFLWTDGRTHALRKDGRTSETSFIRSTLSQSRPNSTQTVTLRKSLSHNYHQRRYSSVDHECAYNNNNNNNATSPKHLSLSIQALLMKQCTGVTNHRLLDQDHSPSRRLAQHSSHNCSTSIYTATRCRTYLLRQMYTVKPVMFASYTLL